MNLLLLVPLACAHFFRRLVIETKLNMADLTYCANYQDIEVEICKIEGWMCSNIGNHDQDTCMTEFDKSREVIEVGCDGTQEDCTDTLLDWASASWPWFPVTNS